MKMKRGRERFKKFKPYLFMLSSAISKFPKSIRKKLYNAFRMTQGTFGLSARYILLKSLSIHCGDNVSIHPGVYLFQPENLKIGNNVSIHPMCYIDATGYIEIGNDVSIAHGVTIMSTNHRYGDYDIPIKDQGVDKKSTIISNNVWIGAKATILAGINISQGSVIAAGAVLTKNVEENQVVCGVPAKTVKNRVSV